jgi:1-acyl-sn-glycerol-3-phosphate acyltransferase
MLYASLPSPTVRMLAKTELFKIPVWGRAVRAAEFIEVDRRDHQRAIASIEHAARLVREGVSIWMAPEGTRSKTGEVLPLKKGGFHLAADTATPIVPVAIKGTLAILPPGGASMAKGRRVEVTIGAPIDPHGRDLASLSDEVRTFLVAHAR